MRLFVIFLSSLALCCGTSYLAYKLFKLDVSPTLISLVLLTLFMFLPEKWINKLNGKE